MTNIALLPAITGAANTSQDGDCYLAFGFQNSGAAIDLTGISFSLQWKIVSQAGVIDNSQVLLSASTSGNYLTNSGVTGVVNLAVPASKMSTIPAGTYQADLIACGDSETIVVGTITFTQSVLGASIMTSFTSTPRNTATANSVGYIPGPGWNQWKGNWSSTANYVQNDVVFEGVSSWIALSANLNQQPASGSTYWNLVAEGLDPTALNAAVSSAQTAASTATSEAAAAAASQSAASTSASGATASETAAAGSATAAAASQTAAASSATAAASSATAAASSATTLEAAVAQFNTLYLGKHASDPTVDGNGNALVAGAEYFNTTEDKLRVYSGTAWGDYDATAQTDASNAALSATNAAASAASAATAATNAEAYATGFSIGTVTTGTAAATITGAPGSQKLNLVIPLSSYTLPAASASALGGVESSTAPTNEFATGINTSGQVTYSQPSFGNISGTLGVSQLPTLSVGGFLNKFRNGTFDIWQRGIGAIAVAANGIAYTADGWYVWSSSAALSAQRGGGRPGGNSLYSLRINGAAGVTNCGVTQRIESYLWAALAGKPVTVQLWIYNNTGAAFTPSFATYYPTAQDNWSSQTSDAAGTFQSCPSGQWTQVAYTFTPSASSAGLGYEFTIGFGPVTSGQVQVAEADIRWTPGIAAGVNNSPPPAELRSIFHELAFCQRYYVTSYGNGNAPAARTAGYGAVLGGGGNYGGGTISWNVIGAGGQFPVQMRATPTVTVYDNAGTAGKITIYSYNTGGFANAEAYSSVYVSSTAIGVTFVNAASGLAAFINCDYVATAEL